MVHAEWIERDMASLEGLLREIVGMFVIVSAWLFDGSCWFGCFDE